MNVHGPAYYTGDEPFQPNPEWGDCGYDLTITEPGTLNWGEPPVYLRTNTAVALPAGYWGLILGRSSAEAKHGVRVVPGVIDNGWRGELLVGVCANSNEDAYVEPGMRLAQLIPIHQAPPLTFRQVEELPGHARGTNGFGSSGHVR